MKFRKKPIEIEAVQWLGWNTKELVLFGVAGAYELNDKQLQITTLEGGHIASVGDWIIKGIKGRVLSLQAGHIRRDLRISGRVSNDSRLPEV